MLRDEGLPCWPRRPLAALLMAAAFFGTVTRAQSPQASPDDHRGYRDLVVAATGTYGVELRGTDDPARVEARVGPNTSLADKFRATRFLAKATQPFVVKWSAREVSVNAGGQSINYRAAWRTGDAVRIAARGDARVTIVMAGGKRVGRTAAGAASPGTPSDLVLAGAHLTGNWTLEGTIDWPDEPGPEDAVLVTVGHQDPAVLPVDRQRPNMLTGGVADPFVFSPPSGIARQPRGGAPIVPTLTWNAPNGSRNWSTVANWLPQRAPSAGDVISLPSGAEKNAINDVAAGDPALGGVVVSFGAYFLDGNGLTLGAGSSSQIQKDFGVVSLAGAGTIELTGQTILSVGSEGRVPVKATTTFSGTLIGDRGQLVKDGSGSIVFTGDASGIERTNVREGVFFLRGGGKLSLVSVTKESGRLADGRFVMTDGTVQQLRVLQDGVFGDASAGMGTVTGPLVDFQSTFQMEDMKYRQKIDAENSMKVFVTGEVRLSYNGFSQLFLIDGGSAPPQGTNLFMVINDGTDAVNGLFRHPNDAQVPLPEGSTVTLNGVSYTLSYRCNAEKAIPACDGTGNDIGLTVASGGARPDLTISKTPAVQTIVQGQAGTFTLTVTNAGTAATAGSVTVTDTLPSGFTAQSVAPGSGWGCDLMSDAARPVCTRTDVLAPMSAYPSIVLTALAATNAAIGTRNNTATVGNAGDTNATNNTATASVTVTVPAPPVNLQITKTAAPTTFERGSTGQYTIVVSNPAGGTPSSGTVTVTDAIPSALVLASVTAPAGWTCSQTTPISCTLPGPIAAGASFTIVVNVSVPAGTVVTSVVNTVNLSGGGDPDGATASVATPIAGADLTISKVQPAPFVRGQSGTFTLTVSNSVGASGASRGTVTVTDSLPAGLTPTGPTGTVNGWACTLAGQNVSCTRSDSIAAGSSYPDIPVTVNVALGASADLTNTAAVSGGADITPASNTSTIPVLMQSASPVPDLRITKSHTGAASQGGTVTFTLGVNNVSLATTTAEVVVTDPLPGVLLVTSATGGGWTCGVAQTVTCTRPGIGPNQSVPITITATVAPDAVGTFTNTATLSGGGDLNLPRTASDTFTVNDQRQPNLIVVKAHTGDFTPGQTNATFSIVVTNQGPVSATGTVTVGDTLPGGLTPTSGSGSGWTCSIQGQRVECTRQDALASGSSYSPITIVASVALNAQSGANIATVSGGGDTTPANSPPDNFIVMGTPRLSIAKSHEGDFFVGQQGATYTVLVSSVGTAPTSGEVIVNDPVPLGMTPVSAGGAGWTCAVAAQTVDCRRSDALAPQQTFPALTITVNVGLVAMTTTNIASVSGGGDQQPGASGPDSTTILGRAELTILKSHPDPVIQGERGLPFTVLVSNNGTGPTAGMVTVTDTLPAGLALVDAFGSGWGCVIAGATVTCSRADVLAQAQSYPAIQIRADVAAGATSTVNEATVSGGGDTTPNDNVARDVVPISPAGQPNLILAKEHEGDFSQGQQGAAYRLRVANAGQASTTGLVTVADNLPAGLAPASASGSGWACTIASQSVTCTRSDPLAPGAAFPLIVILVNVAANATDVVNVASLSGGGDQTTGDNTSTDETHIVVQAPDLSVAKRHVDPFLTGQQGASYQITVRNVGTAPTVGEVVVVDQVPAGLTPVSGSGDGWSCAVAAQTLTCRRSDSLAPGASFPDVTLIVNVAPNATNLVNVVSVSGGGDPTTDNNVDGDNTSINLSPDPTISLSRLGSLVVLGTAEFEAIVTNLGPGLLGGQTDVVAVFPTELVPLSGFGNGWQCATEGQRVRCSRIGPLSPDEAFATIQFRTLVRVGPTAITVAAVVANDADRDLDNNVAVIASDIVLPTASLAIVKRTTTPRVEIGGVAGYEIDVTNTGDSILLNAVVHDRLPRDFVLVRASTTLRSPSRTQRTAPSDAGDGNIEWPVESLAPGETVTLIYLAIVGAGARSGPQDNRATVEATGRLNTTITAGPAIATVEVTTEVFAMLQALVGRVFEDVDGNGMFGDGDRPLANARVITSTGQAALTDPAGLYNIPSLGAGTVAVSLDRDTVPAGLTLVDGPGGRSWTRLLRTPIGGGALLSQNFPLRPSAGVATTAAPAAPPERTGTGGIADVPDAGVVPPRRSYESRLGSSLLIGLGEVSFGRAAQEFELFGKDEDVWGYGSVFYQGALGSPKNRFTLAADSRRRLNGTTDSNRLFELDPNDRKYPLFGDASMREEFATSNSKVFARLERGASYGMWGDLLGDLPSSDRDGGRWSSYQRHLTGAEFRLANARGNHVTIRGAQPETAYAREVFAGGAVGWLTLRHPDLLAGTETVAIEVRDRRTPERVLSRDVLRRGIDYQLEPATGTVYLQRHVSGLDPQLNLVQIVITYEHESAGLDQLVFGGRASATMSGLRIGGTFFTEEGQGNGRFTVGGFDLDQRLPRNGRLRLDVPYSTGTPAVESSVDSRPVDANARAKGFAVQAEVEQPFAFWNGVARGAYLQADNDFRNPFSATITPGATYASGSAELSPFTSSRIRFGAMYERDDAPTVSLDARRSTVSGEWAQSVGRGVTFKGGYDGRNLDRNGVDLKSGLFTGQAIVKFGDRVEGRAGREQNVRDDKDPTYPDQTTLGARVKVARDTSIFYTQRISDQAIVPIGDFAATGFSQLATKGELNIGVEAQVKDATQLTSGYRVEQGVNGPDAFALIGVFTHVKLGRTVGTSFGLDRGQLIDGEGDSYTSGSFAVDWLPSDRFKTTTRYEGRDRGGYSSRLSAGVAARLHAGVTGLTRVQWAQSAENLAAAGDAVGVLAAFAVRPATNDRLGWLLSYQYVDRDVPLQTVAPGRSSSGWRHLFSTDGYAQPVKWLQLHGKFAWQRSELIELRTDTYLWQARAQFALSRFVDAAFEERYLYQPASSSHREGTAMEVGFWPLADVRTAVGYNFRDTRDPFGRDLQGRDKGAYLTLSTKLSRLFDLFGSKPPR